MPRRPELAEKSSGSHEGFTPSKMGDGQPERPRLSKKAGLVAGFASLLCAFQGFQALKSIWTDGQSGSSDKAIEGPFGVFPKAGDPFHFLPCTSTTLPPPLDDPEPATSWGRLYDPDPANWSWGKSDSTASSAGIYLCGYLDVPLDWTNSTLDTRITRLAVTKYQIGGPSAPKTERTIVIEPGGPGGSGTSYVWRAAEDMTKRASNGTFDVLGWDPRGVNTSQPAASCFPYDADRDRWNLVYGKYRASVLADTRSQLELADALDDAVFAACAERLGDLPRFLGTGLVARDLDAIRDALGEPELTGYLVSYGTGIGQTYAQLFPGRVGRVVLDGTEYVPDHRKVGGFGWTSLDNVTDGYRDGFLQGCVDAGEEYCALAKVPDASKEVGSDPNANAQNAQNITAAVLEERLATLVASIAKRPVTGYTPESGPSIITYASLVGALYSALYNPPSWPAMAAALYDLEQGNSSLIAKMLDSSAWEYSPEKGCSLDPLSSSPSSDELTSIVVCADSYDALPPALDWYDDLWENMTAKSWISGDPRFYTILPCRHFVEHFPEAPAGVYRGGLNATLANPILLVAEVYDPATPLRNGRRLAHDMGYTNARMVVHHGFGHASMRHPSACTDAVVQDYILNGVIPFARETHCHPDEKPYLIGVKKAARADEGVVVDAESETPRDYVAEWRSHVEEMTAWNPRLVRSWR